MRARCFRQTHPAYAHYSGRGITVCERWNSYENFLADMDRRPSPLHELERIDNDGNYEPGNCRWATRSEQMRNTRRTRLSAEDVAAIRESTQSNSHLARRFSVSANTIKDIRQGVIWR